MFYQEPSTRTLWLLLIGAELLLGELFRLGNVERLTIRIMTSSKAFFLRIDENEKKIN